MKISITIFITIFFTALIGCGSLPTTTTISPPQYISPAITQTFAPSNTAPKIASWLAKKDEIIASRKPYALVMSGWFTPEEAAQIKSFSPDALLLAGLSVNWVWANNDWMTFLTSVASYGKTTPFTINETMYLRKPDGSKVTFGWASEEWGHEEIYAMDPRNEQWINLITSFYKNVLDQPQHDGIIVDMLVEVSWSPETISNEEWITSTRSIFPRIDELNTSDKLVIFNSGRDLSEIDAYGDFMDGFLMENFMGGQLRSTFEDGLNNAANGYIVIYAVDTVDTGEKDPNKMRLGLVLSLLNDNAYFTYDFGPRDHGQAWWFSEYDVTLGKPLGNYYLKNGGYYRNFEKGIVVAAPNSEITVSFNTEYVDVSSGIRNTVFQVSAGDGRIFLTDE